MTIICAGGEYGTYSGKSYNITASQYRSQLFPGRKNVAELTNDSHIDYGGNLFNKNTDGTLFMNKPITDIQENNGLISFKFMGGDEAMDIHDLADDTLPVTYYTLDGILAENPQKPGVYLVRQGTQTRKVFLR